MSGFVDECLREWKRLGVTDDAANEMAADLQADLDEAARDGASPVDLLGSEAADPRGFAVAWASARRLIPPRRQRSISLRWAVVGGLVLLAMGAVAFAATARVHKVRVVTGTRTVQNASMQAVAQQNRAVGTEVRSVALFPDNVKLAQDTVPKAVGRPSEIKVNVDNSGQTQVPHVRVVLRIGDAYSASRTTGALRPGYARWVVFNVPRSLSLPRNLRIVASAVPQPGERNTSNNRRAWSVRLKG